LHWGTNYVTFLVWNVTFETAVVADFPVPKFRSDHFKFKQFFLVVYGNMALDIAAMLIDNLIINV